MAETDTTPVSKTDLKQALSYRSMTLEVFYGRKKPILILELRSVYNTVSEIGYVLLAVTKKLRHRVARVPYLWLE